MVNLLSHLFQPANDRFIAEATQKSLFKTFVGILYDTFSSHLSSAAPVEELASLASGRLWDEWCSFIEGEASGRWIESSQSLPMLM